MKSREWINIIPVMMVILLLNVTITNQSENVTEYSPYVGNPIHAGTGNKYQMVKDYSSSASGTSFTRYYNSLDDKDVGLGIGWRHTYSKSLDVTSSSAVYAKRADGKVFTFTKDSAGNWITDPDTPVVLTQTSTGWLYQQGDNSESYNAQGQLVSVSDNNGIKITLTYDVDKLLKVTDRYSRETSFLYDAANKIATVNFVGNESVTYSYDTNTNLVKALFNDGTSKQYLYEDIRFPNALTGRVDENNNQISNYGYDADGRGILTEKTGGLNRYSLVYNADGTTTVTDPSGAARIYHFETHHGVTKVVKIEGGPCTSCSADTTAATYDANGFIASKTDYNGNVTTYINNASGLQTSRTEAVATPAERTITTVWNSTTRRPLKITEPGKTTDFAYDTNGNLVQRTKTDTTNNKTRTVNYTYNTFGKILSVDQARTDVIDITLYSYDAQGNLTQVKNALGHISKITSYDAAGRPLIIVDANGLTTTLSYDSRGRLKSRSSGSETTTITYDTTGNLKTITLPNTSSLTYGYDLAQRLISVKDHLGNTITYTLDAAGNRVKEEVKDASGILTQSRQQTYNNLNQLIGMIGAQNQQTSFGYDGNGNRITTTDAASATTLTAFDALNRVISVTDPLTGISTYSYDAQGNLTTAKDANNSTTSYTYDGFGNRTSQMSLDTGTTTYTYDAAGNVLSFTDAKVQSTTYQYDALNRVAQTTYADGTTVLYSYDQGVNQLGRLITITTTSPTNGTSSLTYGYDLFGRMTSKTQTVNGVSLNTAYAYDAQGQLSSMTYPSGSTVTYSYLNGQPSGISVNGKTVLSNINYEAFSSVKGWTWGNGSIHSRGFDLDGQLISQSLANDTRTLGYDAKGNITSINDANVNQLFGYDELNRLTAANDASFNQTFSYDANGNRLSLTESTAIDTYGYDASNTNRLTSISGTTVKTYQYDANGNITHDGLHGYTYDGRNRLTSIDTTLATYQHNALGQRVQKNAAGNITQFYYDEQGQLIAEADSIGFVTKEYVYLNGQPVAVNVLTPPSTTQYTLNTVDSSGNTATWQLDTALHSLTITAPAENLNGTFIVAANDWWEEPDIGQAKRQFALRINTPDGRLVIGLLSIENSTLTGRFLVYTQPAAAQYLGNFELAGNVDSLLMGIETLSSTAASLQWDALQSTLSLTEYSGLMTGSYIIDTNNIVNMLTPIGNATLIFYTDVQQRLLSALLMEANGMVAANVYAQVGDIRLADYAGSVTNTTQSTLNYIHTDHLGTPRAITNESNTTLWSWHSDPFGKTLPNDDVDGDGVGFEFNLRFAGQYYDVETDLHYNYFRDYDPSTGRYVQSDPIGLAGGLNTYGYVGGNPLLWSDPYGLSPISYLAKLTKNGLRRGAALTREAAIKARKDGKNIVSKTKRDAIEIDRKANINKGDQLVHQKGHPLRDSNGNPTGIQGQPHAQTDGVPGHSFWTRAGMLGGVAILLEGMSDVAEAIEVYDPINLIMSGGEGSCPPGTLYNGFLCVEAKSVCK